MKALILAAGMGLRLKPLTDFKPKCMTQVNGQPIIDKQIDNLVENGITDIIVITGYLSDSLTKDLKTKYPFIKTIEAVNYATTNNMYSAWLGRESIGNSDFIMMNADVFFDSSVLTSLLKFEKKNAIIVDIGTYNEESMKVTTKNGALFEISKQITEKDALGSSIDVYKFSASAGEMFFKVCEDYIIRLKELKKWSEVALNDLLKKVKFYACPLNGRWMEIDNHDDLKAAEKIFFERDLKK